MSQAMMMMMSNSKPTARIKATRAWEQPAFADRGEPTMMSPQSIRDCNARGQLVYDKNGNVITKYDGLPDSDFANGTYNSTTGTYSGGGRYGDGKIDNVPWQPHFMDILTTAEDVCYAFLGVETTRPLADGHHYKIRVKKHTPQHGCWRSSRFATAYVPWRTYRAATGSTRIEEIVEEDGTCTVTMIDQADGNKETVTFSTLTDSDDLENRPSVQTGNVAAKHGTVDTTITQALKLAGHISSPISQLLKVGGPVSTAYDQDGVRTRWEDGKTWTVSSNTGYWATCHFYCTNYYWIEYVEDGEKILDLMPIYDYQTKQAGFINRINGKIIFAARNSRRRFIPIFDDGFVIPEEDET